MFSPSFNQLGLNPGVLADAQERERIRLLQAGSEEAFQALVSEFAAPVYRLATRLLTDRADASDVAQEVFLKIFRGIGQFQGHASLKTWIYHITINAVWNQNRWWKRHRSAECALESSEPDSMADGLPADDDAPDPLQALLSLEAQELVQKALAKLSESYRTVLILREIEGLSYDELAEVLGLSPGTVKSRLARARQSLRRALENEAAPATQPLPAWRTAGAD
jgi:RNA polymerase sigma-70 factor (ECF subfamily)